MKPLHLLASGTGRRVVLWRPALIGRGSEATLFAEEPGVAERHARLARASGGWSITPEGGAVYVDGGRIGGTTSLRPGSRLAIGSLRLEVAAPSLRLGRRSIYVATAIAALVALLAGWAVAAPDGPGGPPVLQVEPDGQQVEWSGPSDRIELLLPLADPARVLVDLHLEAAAPLDLFVNGAFHRSIDAGFAGRLGLQGLGPGRNRILLAGRDGGQVAGITARVDTTPVPACDAGACDVALEQARARASRLLREQRAAPGNLYESWRWLRRARGLAAGTGADAVRAAVEQELDRVAAALDERCAALEFAAARHLALDDPEAARAVVNELLAAFPEEDHRCRAIGTDLRGRMGG